MPILRSTWHHTKWWTTSNWLQHYIHISNWTGARMMSLMMSATGWQLQLSIWNWIEIAVFGKFDVELELTKWNWLHVWYLGAVAPPVASAIPPTSSTPQWELPRIRHKYWYVVPFTLKFFVMTVAFQCSWPMKILKTKVWHAMSDINTICRSHERCSVNGKGSQIKYA